RGASPTNDVDVFVDALATLGVIVVEAESVRLGLFEEVDDLAVLTSALGDANLIHRCFARRRVCRDGWLAGWSRRGCRRLRSLRWQRSRLDHERCLPWIGIHEARDNVAVGFLENL